MISKSRSHKKIAQPRSGQTLVIAVMIMFIVALVAAVFIGLVARNLFRSERYSNVDAVQQYAEAGVRYADKMLTSSEEGADWRPVPDNHGVTGPGNPPAAVNGWQNMRDTYPDFKWTRAYWPEELPTGTAPGQGYAGPTGGYTTYKTGKGRFLLRVSYNPNINDPLSKYIKIESIGRMGTGIELDPTDPNKQRVDPTTLKPNGDLNLRREITAYKPIGVTDYLRYVTNKDARDVSFALGCPGFTVKMGRSDNESRFGSRGAPIRVNGNLTWYGDGNNGVQIHLRGIKDYTGGWIPVDRVEVAGKVEHAQDSGVFLTRMQADGSIIDNMQMFQSDDDPGTASWTAGGFYRDSYPQGGEPTRRIKRLEAPLVDQPDPTNTTTRYRLLTLNSGERINVGNRWVNIGEYGWGRGVYIGNTSDVQSDSQTLKGLMTLRSVWLKPGSTGDGSGWYGPYYVPKGVKIDLHPNYMSITRTDPEFTVWYDAWGQPRPEWGRTVNMPYPDAANGRTVKSANGATKDIDGNGVIYAEGNIRIKGMLPQGMQLTVVSGQNIYIEGNLLKYRSGNWDPNDDDHYRGADNTCGLALLAKQYVVVNTTQFFAPRDSLSSDDMADSDDDGTRDSLLVSTTPGSVARFQFDFGPWESDAGDLPNKWLMLLRHTGQKGNTYINARLNYGYNGTIYNGLLGVNTNWMGRPAVPLSWYIWGVGDPNYIFPGWGTSAPGWGIDGAFACETFPLETPGTVGNEPTMNANLVHSIGVPNLLEIALDQSSQTRKNYMLAGMAIQPYDIRIEAVIYAQDGSFFVIPGPWFNPNPSDTPGKPNRPGGTADRFPYYGQALDTRIIIDGAISENVPAPIGDVEEWMRKWGRIPDEYGSTNDRTAHPGEGLTMLYDDHAGWPMVQTNNGPKPIREDSFGRALPFTPRLPVTGSLIYFGDVM